MLDIRQEVVRALAQAVHSSGRLLGSVPALLRRVIAENMWQERAIGENEKITIAEFRAFVEREYPEGLGTTIETLEALCRLEPDIMDYLAQVKRGKRGAPLGNDNKAKHRVNDRGNIVETSIGDNVTHYIRGNNKEYAYNRLRDESFNPDGSVKNPQVVEIYRRVTKGEITPHAGMVKAGFRVRKIAINLSDPHSAAKTIRGNMSAENISLLIELLSE